MAELIDTFTMFIGSYGVTLAMGLVCAYLGLYCVLRRIVFTGVALAQLSAAGVAGAFFLKVAGPASWMAGVDAYGPTAGSMAMSLLGILGLRRRGGDHRLTPDARVGIAYAVSAAAALLLVGRSSEGLQQLKDIMAGEVLLATSGTVIVLLLGLVAVAAVHVVWRREFLLSSFDPEFAQARGLPLARYELALLISLAVAVALSLRVGGLLLVFAYLVLPPVAGLSLGRGLRQATLYALATAALGSLLGFGLAIRFDWSVGPAVAIALLLLVIFCQLGRWRPSWSTGLGRALLVGAGGALLVLPVGFLKASLDESAAHMAAVLEEVGSLEDADHGPTHIEGLAPLSGHPHGEGYGSTEVEPGSAPEATRLEEWLFALGEPGRAEQAAAELEEALEEFPACFAALQGYLSHPSENLRVRSALFLAARGDDHALGVLVRSLADAELSLLLRDEVGVFLTSLADGETFGYDAFASAEEQAAAAARWEDWLHGRREEASPVLPVERAQPSAGPGHAVVAPPADAQPWEAPAPRQVTALASALAPPPRRAGARSSGGVRWSPPPAGWRSPTAPAVMGPAAAVQLPLGPTEDEAHPAEEPSAALVEELRALLASEEPALIRDAVRIAGTLRVAELAPDLVRRLPQADESLRAAILGAIEKIGGEGPRRRIIDHF